ncbi:hypothetical protein ACUOA8_55045, partial [Escherichia sp. SS-MK2]
MKNTKLLLAIATSAALLTGCQNDSQGPKKNADNVPT